jgi:hypothetical protein
MAVKQRLNSGRAGPEAPTGNFVRICVGRYAIRQSRHVRMLGRAAAGEGRASKIQCSPKEVDRAHLANEAEHVEDPCGLQQDTPESLHILRVVFLVREILIEGNGLRDFNWRARSGRGSQSPRAPP